MVWFTSDLHLNHNKDFVWGKRGFKDITEHNNTIIHNINEVVMPEDTLYILGDLVLGGVDADVNILKRIKCKNIKMVIGNHDTNTRVEKYKEMGIEILGYANFVQYKKQKFMICHYCVLQPIVEDALERHTISLYGHTHQTQKFASDNPWMINIGLDANNNYPISAEQVIQECKNKWNECKAQM